MKRIELADFLLIAESHLGIDASALARMDRVVALASAALAAPFAGFGDVEVFPAFEARAAVYCSRIVKYHPLPDANKRTGYDVMREFIDRNGFAFEHPAGGLMETAAMIEDLAAETVSEDDFEAWLGERIKSA
jgi:death-on-curing protein